jgi:heme oxygenase
VTKAYGLTDEGMDFFRYPDVADPRAYLAEYHARMNSMPLDADARMRVVEEGVRAFELNIDLTDELAADFGITGPGEEEADRILRELAAEHP